MKKNICVVIINIVLIICFLCSYAKAQDIEDLTNKQNEIKNNINDANGNLSNVQTEITDVLGEIQELEERISSYELEIQALTIEIESVEKSLEEEEAKFAIAEKQYNDQKELLDNRLIAIYEEGETSYIDFLLKSSGIADFLSSYYLITEITQNDNDLLDSIEENKAEIAKAKEKLEKKRETLRLSKKNREKTSISLENAKIVKNNYMAQLNEEEKQLQNELSKYREELSQIESEIVRITMANMDSNYAGGIMAWPVPGYTRITSPFGMRTHPITGLYKLHTGVDIGAPTGARFIAANDGVVTKAAYNSSYGNMVIIDHGGGVSTLYAHGSQILVNVGDKVTRGQAVLKVGSTGWSTGPHAHFEVRINGRYVNPLDYIMSNN